MADLATSLLTAWERGLAASPVERGLVLLSLALPDRAFDELARVSVGERDARLLSLRERAFGTRMTGRVACPSCGTDLELEISTADLRVEPGDVTRSVQEDGYDVAVRPADSTDLAALSADDDLATNARRLLTRCVLTARVDGEPIPADLLPPGVAASVSEHLSAVDPQSDVRISTACPDCGRRWQAPLDIASYLWAETHAWACRVLREIHTIAAAYGWAERDILAMSPTRRQVYLDLIQS